MLRILTLAVLLRPPTTALSSSDVTSYTRVSKNGQLARSYHDSLSSIERPSARNDTRTASENRSMNDVVSITVSPIYAPVRTQKLKKGEAIDHSAVASKYSTLDREMIAKLDAAMTGKRRQIQHRFHAPAIFDHGNGKPQKGTSTSNAEATSNSSPFPGPLAPDIYDYSPAGLSDDQVPASKPMISSYPSTDEKDFPPDSYRPSPNVEYHAGNHAHEMDFSSGFDGASYENDGPTNPKPIKFTNHHYDDQQPPPFTDDDRHHDDFYHHHHHELIYDHVPEFYSDHHYHHETTTEEPEMNDQRLDKRPYSYYFIGKKLWYIPLYFSIYFIIYIAALVLKSIARHKIDFPAHLADAVSSSHSKRESGESSESWWNFAERILDGAERFAEGSENKGSQLKWNETTE